MFDFAFKSCLRIFFLLNIVWLKVALPNTNGLQVQFHVDFKQSAVFAGGGKMDLQQVDIVAVLFTDCQ